MIRRKKTLPAAKRLGSSSSRSESKVVKSKKPFTGSQPGRQTMLPADEVQEQTRSAASRDTENTVKDIKKRASKPVSG